MVQQLAVSKPTATRCLGELEKGGWNLRGRD
jgi:hypothetical protein